MIFTSPSQYVVLALCLLAGFFLGLAARSGRKWQKRYVTERDAHAVTRRDAEARLTANEARTRELEAGHGRLAQADARIAELEREREAHAAELAREREAVSLAHARTADLDRENGQLRSSATVAPVASVAPASSPTTTAPMPLTRRVVGGDRAKRGWFDWGPGSDPRARR
jgi:septal ring factor EnvC (AmiA/AmiB activator)